MFSGLGEIPRRLELAFSVTLCTSGDRGLHLSPLTSPLSLPSHLSPLHQPLPLTSPQVVLLSEPPLLCFNSWRFLVQIATFPHCIFAGILLNRPAFTYNISYTLQFVSIQKRKLNFPSVSFKHLSHWTHAPPSDRDLSPLHTDPDQSLLQNYCA